MPIKLNGSGSVKTSNVQLGQDADPLKNFTLMIPAVPDGTMEIRRGNAEAPGALIVKINPDGGMSTNSPTFSAVSTAATNLVVGSDVKMAYQAEEWDSGNCYDTALSRFQPKQAGYYYIYANAILATTATRMYIYLHKNGLRVRTGVSASEAQFSGAVGAVVYMNGTSDYVEVFASAAVAQAAGGNSQTVFQAHLARAA